jgi:hypothetical protein
MSSNHFPTEHSHILHPKQITTILLRGCESREFSPKEHTFWFVVGMWFQFLQLPKSKKTHSEIFQVHEIYNFY